MRRAAIEGIVGLWTKSYTGQAADGAEMFSVSSAKGQAGVNRCGCDQSIGELNAVGKSMLFDDGDRCGADSFGKGQDSELELAKRLLDLARFEL